MGVVGELINQEKVLQEDVAVLSPYRAHCSELTKRLKKSFMNVAVSTVVAAQGLFCLDSNYRRKFARSQYMMQTVGLVS